MSDEGGGVKLTPVPPATQSTHVMQTHSFVSYLNQIVDLYQGFFLAACSRHQA